MSQKTLTITIVILLIISLALAYFIYTADFDNAKTSSEQVSQRQTTQQGQIGEAFDGTNQEFGDFPPPIERGYSDDELRVLEFPADNATEAERQAHDDLVLQLTLIRPALDITDCRPETMVYQIQRGAMLRLLNASRAAVTLNRGEGYTATVPAEGEITVPVSQLTGDGAGINGYACVSENGATGIGSNGVAGILHVVEP